MTSYVAGDVRAIKEYVFGSPRLLEMRGGSSLVDAFDRGVVPHLVSASGGEMGFAGGGNFLARWVGEGARGAAVTFEAKVRNAFLDVTGSEGLTVVHVETEDPFEEAQERISAKLAAAKREPSGARQLASMPFLKRCESCGREAADTNSTPGAEPDPERRRWVGPICERKRRMLAALRELAKKTEATDDPPQELLLPLWGESIPVSPFSTRLLRQAMPADFRELTGDDDLAVVVADGNGLGEWFEGLGWKAYGELSASVQDALRSSLEGALDALFPAAIELRVQVLISGGDDLVAALPARFGLRFAQEVVEGFRVEHQGSSRGMAAGVLVARPGFPFRAAHSLAEELLLRAKARCRESGLCSAVDFHRVKGTHVQSLHAEREMLRRQGPGGRVWSYGASGPFSPDELRELLGLAHRLRTEVSASQRGVLREILSPRDDGPQTPLEEGWGVPKRVYEELALWLGRQEKEPFELGRVPSQELVSAVSESLGAEPVEVARLRLADALLLADLDAGAGGA